MRRKISGLMLAVYAASTLLFSTVLQGDMVSAEQNPSAPDFSISATDLAVMSLNAVYPGVVGSIADSRDNENMSTAVQAEDGRKPEKDEVETVVVKNNEEDTPEPRVFGEDPVVLIVHTHATETYLPATEGNYHSKKKENSVRDVGQVLAESLEEEGISVVHDETLHDSPSYSSSYSRSYETIEKLLDQYPAIECVIDLHRDAIASEGSGAVVSAGGKTCAKYMYVVSTAVPTYKNNLKFVNALNQTAVSEFGGFTGSVLERGYQYNQGLADKYLLVEFGNNRNHIEDVRNTARIYGKILAKTLKAGY